MRTLESAMAMAEEHYQLEEYLHYVGFVLFHLFSDRVNSADASQQCD